MKNAGRFVLITLAVLSGCFFVLGLNGCGKSVVKEEATGPVFFPEPPNQPKLQFLTSYSGGEQFNIEKPSFLESFVLGDAEVKAGTITQPYGVAIHDGKIYVCDIGQGNIKVMDLVNNMFSLYPSGRSIRRPVNLFIEPDGTKYVADTLVDAICVWGPDDKLRGYLGKKLGIKPLDVYVQGDRVYATDLNSNQVVVLDKNTGDLVEHMGKELADRTNWQADEFSMITDLTVDKAGDIYVGDKLKGKVTVFNSDGKVVREYGKPGSTASSLIRVKGMAVDREGNVWVVDAGPAMAVKVFRKDGRLLMLFGLLGLERGQMYMPADIVIDYDNIDLFSKYAVEGAKIEFLVLVTNQYGPHKVSVYGFGSFPEKYSLSVGGDKSKKAEGSTPESADKAKDGPGKP
jgi:outer membrane protein assembly factor BamB